jgi:hypothetical protein
MSLVERTCEAGEWSWFDGSRVRLSGIMRILVRHDQCSTSSSVWSARALVVGVQSTVGADESDLSVCTVSVDDDDMRELPSMGDIVDRD